MSKSIFNKYGNLIDPAHDAIHAGSDALWDKLAPLLDGLPNAEARALEQAVAADLAARFAEHRLRVSLPPRKQ